MKSLQNFIKNMNRKFKKIVKILKFVLSFKEKFIKPLEKL